MSSTIILCPGQGAQHVGMGKPIVEQSPEARAIFERAAAVLGFDLAKVCFEGPESELTKTDISQPAIYVTSVASYQAARAAGTVPAAASAFAGLSLGEYTALHLGGVFDFETGLRLVAERGRAMQAAAEASLGSMVAVIGANEEQVDALIAQNAQDDVLVPANFNAPGQIVVSGTTIACGRFTEEAIKAGYRAIPLTVAGAFHSPLMQPGADRMKEVLATATLQAPSVTVYSNVTAEPHTDVESIKRLLIDQVVKPVRWDQTMAKLANVEGNKFIELAPGKVLTGLLKKQNRRADVMTLGA